MANGAALRSISWWEAASEYERASPVRSSISALRRAEYFHSSAAETNCRIDAQWLHRLMMS